MFAAAELVFCTWLKGASLQVNRFSKVEDRAIFITDRHLYKMDPMKQYKVMKTIPLYNVSYSLTVTGRAPTAAPRSYP